MSSTFRENLESLRISLEGSEEGDRRYVVTISNVGNDVLVGVQLHYGPLLHPGHFGLDDTYMPRDIWVKPAIEFSSVMPGESIASCVDGYDEHKKYDGPNKTSVAVDIDSIGNTIPSTRSFKASVIINLPNARAPRW